MLADPFEMLAGMTGGASPFASMGGMLANPMMPPMPAFPRHGHNSTSHHHTHMTAGMPGQVQSYSSFNSSNPFSGATGVASYSSSFMSMSSDGTGRPHVYEASSSSVVAPGGVRETKSSVRDSRTGRAEMSVGHHIQDRSHVIKKARNVSTGQIDHEEDFVNVEEEEVQDFERDWQRGMTRSVRAINALGGRGGVQALGYTGRHGGRHDRYRDESPEGPIITEVDDDEPPPRLAIAAPPRPASNAGPSVSFNLPSSSRDRHHERASSESRSLPKKDKSSRSKKPYTRK